jgi:hypothetical protein
MSFWKSFFLFFFFTPFADLVNFDTVDSHNLKQQKRITNCQIGDGSSARKSSARKNCSTQKSRLLDTIQAVAKIYGTAQKSKKCHLEQMQVLDQNVQLLK